MPGDLELMSLHVRALFTHDARGRLLSVNEPGGAGGPAPRLFLGRTRAGVVWRFGAGLPDDLAAELDALCADEPPGAGPGERPRHLGTYLRLLESHAPVRGVEAGPAYRLDVCPEPSRPLRALGASDAESLRGGFEELIEELHAWQPFVALFEGGRAASVCRSVRVTPEAHEAGLETLAEFRGRGYAKEVAAGWARLVRAAGAAPLYSTAWENAASRSVAAKLNLVMYGADFHVA